MGLFKAGSLLKLDCWFTAFRTTSQAIQELPLILAEHTQVLKELAAIPSRIKFPLTPGHPEEGTLSRDNARIKELPVSFSSLSLTLAQAPPQLVIPVLLDTKLPFQHIPFLESSRRRREARTHVAGLKDGTDLIIKSYEIQHATYQTGSMGLAYAHMLPQCSLKTTSDYSE